MRLLNFSADNVHEYLDFDINFRPDVSFLAGLNGTGKTTALKLIMALLTPDIRALNRISFNKCTLKLESNDDVIEITCIKENHDISLEVVKNGNSLGEFSTKEMANTRPFKVPAFLDTEHSLEFNSAIREIESLTQPMFLSLDRRTIQTARDRSEGREMRRESSDIRWRKKSGDDNLNIALELIYKSSAMARSQHAKLDKKLRDEIILTSLTFNNNPEGSGLPDKAAVEQLTKKYKTISKTLKNLDIATSGFDSMYSSFLDRIQVLAAEFNKCKSTEEVLHSQDSEVQASLYEWFMNQDQLKRIDKMSSLVESYEKKKTRYYRELNKFETLVNNFLKETGKEIVISATDQPKIKINGKKKDITILSSGESQILIMLAQLVLNKKLPKNGILIIDEPEISLHISWQDMFVEALQAANPDLQIILATHSPAIIGGRNSMYVPLNGVS
ncbi:AAA family ATPase [Vibrio owensii]|uniref:AAA family ATPase n=1 Tax=Vibrio owensii TaxID=696485 RepID=UPI002FF20F22